jgi:AcrR family transcriptional regulator
MPAERKSRKNKREALVESAIRLVAQKGTKAASVRQIAEAAGVTEAAVYRHFSSKEDLFFQVYCQIVKDMAVSKQDIIGSGEPIHLRIGGWIRVTYEFFDNFPDAFTFVLLTPHNFQEVDEGEITTRQGGMLMAMLDRDMKEGLFPTFQLDLAMAMFTGVMLNVPRLINEGCLAGPACQYADRVVEAIFSMFRIQQSTPAET